MTERGRKSGTRQNKVTSGGVIWSPWHSMPDTKGGKQTNKRKPEGGKAQVGSKGGCKVGRVTPYSITPNLGWPARGGRS